ncbi:hypothetical protein VTN02DRAFT_5599 [Thermoascus thermophilus]
MPLGASITYGFRSTDGNGYRNHLRERLRSEGWKVNMVGSVKAGTMYDNDNEGHIGFRVTEVAKAANKTVPRKPNLILVNAGTNDAVQSFSLATTGDRMNNLLSHLFDAIPGTTIILSTLLPNRLAPKRVAAINDQYRQLAAERRSAGDRLVLAEMDDGFLTIDDLKDGTHPTDEGYGKMAEVWWAAIRAAEAEGLLQKPADTGISDDTARDGVSRSILHSLAGKSYDSRPLFTSRAMIMVYILLGLGFQAHVTGLLS